MNIVLLSGGSGKRLWPLSNAVRSKQFIKFLHGETGNYESMVQRVYRQILSIDSSAMVTVTTSKAQRSVVSSQLGERVRVCVEPSRRDTFAAIALSVAYLLESRQVSEQDAIIFCPIDPYVEASYFQTVLSLETYALSGTANITLMGVQPTYPSEKYGYMLPEPGAGPVRLVQNFFEKPTQAEAEAYIARGALWNCGVFAFKAGYMLDILRSMRLPITYRELYEQYDALPRLSFDYAVVEKEKSIQCIAYEGPWKDIGTWNTLAEEMQPCAIGNVVMASDCVGVNVINELEIPVVVTGLQNVIVAAAPDGILVSEKTASSFIKPLVDNIDQRIMYKEKAWGEMKIVNQEEGSLTISLHLNAGRYMSYHHHRKRDELWIVQDGTGVIRVGNELRDVAPGDVVRVERGLRHTVYASTNMALLEVQLGQPDDEDIIRETIDNERWWLH